MLRFLISIACLAIVVGCGEKQIEVQTVPVGQSSYGVFREGRTADQPAEGTGEKVARRMIVGMFDRPAATWFLKATGSEDAVTNQQEQIFEFFRGISFEQNKPKWELPEGWTVGPKKKSMFAPLATLIIDAESKTQLTISSLGPNQDLLANANRWRAQLGLGPLTQDQIDTEFAKSGDDDFYLFDAVGTGSGQMASSRRPPFANVPIEEQKLMQGADPSAAEKQPLPESNAESGLKYDSPSGWAETQSSGMVPSTRFTKKTDSDASKPTVITLTKLSAAASDWTANAERWADQAGQTFAGDELTTATEELTIDGQSSQLIELLDGNSEMAIVAVMTATGKDTWFFKLVGDKKSVTKEQATFRELLKSINFD